MWKLIAHCHKLAVLEDSTTSVAWNNVRSQFLGVGKMEFSTVVLAAAFLLLGYAAAPVAAISCSALCTWGAYVNSVCLTQCNVSGERKPNDDQLLGCLTILGFLT